MGGGGRSPLLLTAALDGDLRSDSHPVRWTESPSTHWVGGLMGPTASLDAVE
jgi:hypothetical protein